MKRKFLSVFLIVMLLFSVMPVAAFADVEGEVVLKIGSVEGTVVPGAQVEIPVSIVGNPGVAGFEFGIECPDVLTLDSIDDSVNETDYELTTKTRIYGQSESLENSNATGQLATFLFTVNEDIADGTYTIEMTDADFFNVDTDSYKTITVLTGTITVKAPVVEPTKYAVTVNDGTADKAVAAEGETVTVTAPTKEDYTFTGWTSTPTVDFADEKAVKTTFDMPASDVTVTANYEKDAVVPTEYTVTVSGGTANPTKAKAGETVTITANVPAGKVFNGWTGDVTFADASKTTTTFVMPAKDVTVTATYKNAEYKVTVNNGKADKETAEMNQVVSITANAAPTGKVFDKWTGTDVTFTDANKATTTFTMPAKDVTVTATYKDKTPVATQYDVDVTYGDAYVEGVAVTKAAAGDKVTIKADSRSGYTFDEWEVVKGKVAFADEDSATTSFTMPAEAVEVKATYTKNSSGGGSSSGGSGGGGGVVIGGGSTDKDKNEVITNRLILNIDNPVATYNNNEIKNDVAPIIVDGRTYTPARFVAEKLGATVDWNEAAQLVTVTSKDKKIVIELTIGSNTALVNGEKVEMDAAAFIQDSRTYTPARFVAEQLGAEVVWNAMTRQVIVTETVEIEKEAK